MVLQSGEWEVPQPGKDGSAEPGHPEDKSPETGRRAPGDSRGPGVQPAAGEREPAPPKTKPLLDRDEVEAILAGADRDDSLDSTDLDAAVLLNQDEGGADMDRVLLGSGLPEGAADIDAVIGGARPGEGDVAIDETGITPPAVSPKAQGGPQPAGAASARADAVSSADVPDLVGSENLAAAVPATGEVAVPAADDLARELAEIPPRVPEVEPEPSEARQLPGRWRFRPPITPAFPPALAEAIRRNLPKLVASLAAGALCGLSTFVFLSMHPVRSPDTRGGLARTYDLRQGVQEARNLVELGEYSEALKRLDGLIAQAPEGAERADAEFLRIVATYKTLPEHVPPGRAQALRAEIDAFVREAPLNPAVAEALRLKGNLYDREDDPYAARGVYNRILTELGNPSNLDQVLLDVGKTALKLKRYDEAAGLFRRLIDQFPGSSLAGQAKLLLGDAYVAAGQRDAGREVYRQMAKEQPGTRLGAQAYVRLGEMAFNEGRYEEAIKLLEDRLGAATTVEGNDEVYLFLAKAYRDTGHLDKAERILRELLDFFPKSDLTPEALVTLSMVLDKEGMRPEAVAVAMQAAQRYPENAEVLRAYSQLLAAAGEPARAAQALVAASAAGAGDPRLLLDAGRKFRQANQLDQARETLEQLVAEFPGDPAAIEAGIELARLACEQGKAGQAIRRLEDLALVSQGKPGRVPVFLALGKMCQDIGLGERAEQIFEEVAASSTDPAQLAQAAIGLLDAGATDCGLEVANRVDVATLPEAVAYALLEKHGEALLRANSEAAIAKLEQAYHSHPAQRAPEGDDALLKAYLVTGQSAKARALVMDLDTLVKQDPLQAPRLQRASILWGDYLYEKGDFQAAQEAYLMAANVATGSQADEDWARLQEANALLQQDDFEKSAPLFDQVAASKSTWSDLAKLRADYARTEQRLRGLSPSTDKAAKSQPGTAPANPQGAAAAPAVPPAPAPPAAK